MCRDCTLVLLLCDQAELDFYSRQDAAARDSSISAAGIPGLRERGALRGPWGEVQLSPGRRPASPPQRALQPTPILCPSGAAPGTGGDPGAVVTSSLFISFSHSLGSQG